MSEAEKLAPDRDLDARLARYLSLGYSRERALGQLLLARFPIELLRSRFADFPERAFSLGLPPAITPKDLRLAMPPSATTSELPDSVRQIVTRTQQAIEAGEGISFHYVPLIQCSFPHGDPGDAVTFTRQNGWLELSLGTTRPEVGLPYGVPARLLTIYCTSEAIRTRAPEIYLGKTVHEFLRRLDVPVTRGARGSLRTYANQLLRLTRATLSIDENLRDTSGRSGLHLRQALFAEEARLWWDDDHAVGEGSSLLLSQVLFHSILERAAPLSTQAIKALRKSPMDLDVYAWLVHRLFNLVRPSSVSWEQLSQQFGHGYQELRFFRRFFCDSLKRVQRVYPDANLRVSETGLLLLPSRPHVLPRARAPR
jgi:hypothetical protein